MIGRTYLRRSPRVNRCIAPPPAHNHGTPAPLHEHPPLDTHWLHTRWPSGVVEKLPAVREDGSTNVPGLYVAGDLRGVALLKFAADSGARVVRTIAAGLATARSRESAGGVVDIAIIGAGVAGVAAALEARTLGLSFRLLEANALFSTIANFPRTQADLHLPERDDTRRGHWP